jgi:hypothetical protein
VLTKNQIISAIQQVNRTVSTDWLAGFDASSLMRYLDHLQMTLEPRGRESTWMRPGETRAVVTREPAM